MEKRKKFEKADCKIYLVSLDDKFYRRHIDQIKRSYSVARSFLNSDLWDTVKTSVDKRNIKPNVNEITIINRYPQQNRRPPMRFGQDKRIRNEKRVNVIFLTRFCLCCKN